GEARNTCPESSSESNGVLALIVPISDAFGQCPPTKCSRPSGPSASDSGPSISIPDGPSSSQPTRPLAEDGETVVPNGILTSTSRTGGVARPDALFGACGT